MRCRARLAGGRLSDDVSGKGTYELGRGFAAVKRRVRQHVSRSDGPAGYDRPERMEHTPEPAPDRAPPQPAPAAPQFQGATPVAIANPVGGILALQRGAGNSAVV